MENTRNKESLPAKVGSGLKPVSPIDSLAHEIRDPLTTIMASAELLERGVGSGARRRWLLDAILESSERIAAAKKRRKMARFPSTRLRRQRPEPAPPKDNGGDNT